MTSFYRYIRVPALAAVAALFGTLQMSADAALLAPPTSVAVDMTRAADSDASGNYFTYRLTWVDNSEAEEGYSIGYRVGDSGAFNPIQTASANSTATIVTLGKVPKDTVMQFQVGAHRYNGAKVETAYGTIAKITIADATGTMVAPGGLTGELVGDGVVKLKWTDLSNNEMYQQIQYKKTSDANFSHGTYVYFNVVEAQVQFGLVPGTEYQFRLRATRQAPANGSFAADSPHVSSPSNVVTLVAPGLTAPTDLTVTANGESQVRLTWKDNSTNETGYQIESQSTGQSEFIVRGVVNPNQTTVTVGTTPATTTAWRVRAIYKTETVTTAITSAPSNTATLTSGFAAPSELTATTSGRAGSVELAWKDNSTSETSFEVLTRVLGTNDYVVAMVVPAGTTTAIIDSRQTTSGTSTVPLEFDTVHEFTVRAMYGSGESAIRSNSSNSAQAAAKDGFTSLFYHPAGVGEAFDFTLSVSNPGTRSSWTVSGRPSWLNFNASTGRLTGTPNASGVVVMPLTATFSNGWTAQATLTLRVLRNSAAPAGATIADLTFAKNTTHVVPLDTKFSDPESEKAVRLATTKGNLDLLLFPSLTPLAVENFLGYVNSGSYDGVVFHRSVFNFVLQGGAFVPVATPRSFFSVPERPSPKNEPGISNLRGTISAAKVGNNPHSATHDFFLNLADNSTTGAALDRQNGGFTVFGRLAAPSLGVMTAIGALPTGDYVDNNDYSVNEPVYDPALDKRVIIDGSLASFEDWPMDAVNSAPADMDVTKTVQIKSAKIIPVLTYTAESTVPSVVTATVNGTNLELRGVNVGTSTVAVTATDLDGNSTTRTFQVTVAVGFKAAAITKHPTSVAVNLNDKASFSVKATGTSLTYQWRKDGVEITGATSATLNIAKVTEAEIGSYDVIVGNGGGLLTSQSARLDLKAAPIITQDPAPVLVMVGEELVVEATASGAPEPVFAWTRDGRNVAGQKTGVLKIAAAKLSDAGVYRATASNKSGSAVTGEAPVWVVDGTDSVATRRPGANMVFRAAAAGPGLQFRWFKDDVELVDDTLITGSTTAVLSLANVDEDDSGIYTCEVTLPDDEVVMSGEQRFAAVLQPVIDHFTADAGIIGFDYDFTIPYDDSDPANTATMFVIQALPPGLKADPITGRIWGRPTVPGTYVVSVIARNAWGNSKPARGTLEILPLPTAAVGTFVAGVGASALNDELGGRLDLSVGNSGAYSGKLTLGAKSHRFAGSLNYSPGQSSPQSQIVVQRSGQTPVTLSLVINESTGGLSGSVSAGDAASLIAGFRQFWSEDFNPCVYTGSYNMAIKLAATDVGQAAVPQGSGYASITCWTRGTATVTAKLPDGTGILTNSVVGPSGQLVLFQTLYNNTGAILAMPSFGRLNLGTSSERLIRIDGSMRWIKGEQTSGRSYKEGFGPLTLTLTGCTYNPPKEKMVFNLPALEANAELDFSEGGLASWSTNPDMVFTVEANNMVTLPKAGTSANPARIKLSSYARNGMFTGTMQLTGPPPKNLKHSVWFQGMMIPKIPRTPAVEATATTAGLAEIPASDATAEGYFLLPTLPSDGPPKMTLGTSPILAGKVVFRPIGIVISETPTLPAAVNPGTSLSLTVVASGQGTLAYQWRKDGVNISGATNPTFDINSVAEANQGSYDVVITNGATTTVSAPAVLNVNDPVTTVTLARSPSNTSVGTGQKVTFTATANGTSPLTYEWAKGGTVIAGATAATYVIDQASAENDNGIYTVRVSNALTPAGIASNEVALTVVDAVTQVTVSRSPPDAKLEVGESVTFTAVPNGVAPHTYQWSKDGIPISGATSATYTIESVGESHSGSYNVLVFNAATPDGFASGSVALEVTWDDLSGTVRNVVATRSPSDTAVPVGQVVSFYATAEGTAPLSYQWRRNGITIAGATGSSYSITATAADYADFDVVVSNSVNPLGVASAPVSLIVLEPISAVVATRTPSADVMTGESVTFTVMHGGDGPYAYQWRRNGATILGATSHFYVVPSATTENDGEYDVVVSNDVNSQTSNPVSLTVSP